MINPDGTPKNRSDIWPERKACSSSVPDKASLPLAIAKHTVISAAQFKTLARDYTSLAQDTFEELIVASQVGTFIKEYVTQLEVLHFMKLVDIVERAVAKERAF